MNAKFLKTARPFFAVALAAGVAFGVAGCKSNTASQAPIMNASLGPDPAAANLAPADANGQPTQVMGASQSYTPQQQSESYPAGQQAPAPIVRGGAPDTSQYPVTDYGTPADDTYDQGYNNGVADGEALAQTDQAPPPLPEYDQPPAPDDNDIWTPGYWGYANTGYYWVPGAWVAAPYYGALWTPGYWGWYGSHYRWHHGYWGRHIGFYGGINYGWGYVGTGYYGGYWNGNRFYYNRECSHVSPRVTTVYERPVIVNNVRYTNVSNNRVSFNGGRGGIEARPRPYEIAAAREQHVAPLPEQRQFRQAAAANRANAFAENHGRPAQAAFTQPVMTHHMEAPVQRGGFGGRPGEPANGTPAAQRNTLMEQQRNQQFQQQHNLQEQQHNAQLQQQQHHNVQLEQQRNLQLQQQHNAQAEQQRNLQLQQQHNAQTEQQRNLQMQQQRQAEQQHNQQLQQQHNNVFDQHRVDETAQRNALQQQHQQQQVEQQRNLQMQQQRQAEQQQRMQQEQQRNFQVQQQQHIQQQQPQHIEQPRIQQQPQHIEQPRVEQPQHVEQPRMQPQPQHIEQPHVEQHAAPPPHMEAPRPAAPPQGGGGHPGGGGGHPGGGGHQR